MSCLIQQLSDIFDIKELAHRRYLLNVPLDLHFPTSHVTCYRNIPEVTLLKIQALVLVLAL